MTLIKSHGYSQKEHSYVTLLDSFSPFELGNKMSDQPVASLGPNFLIAIIPTTTPSVFKYTKKNLQQIFKIVLEAWAANIFEKSWDKLLKTCSPDMYRTKSYIESYNFC